MDKKPIVFVITPFDEDFLELYNELKNAFQDRYEFTNAGDLDNQRNVLEDIVRGIDSADVIIADLSGLNANVFYELGLAHAMNKKVIIITQNISDLPFDIQSYRANEYSMIFYKIGDLKNKLEKLLLGAIDGTTKFGNPVYDYLPDFNVRGHEMTRKETENEQTTNSEKVDSEIGEEEKGFLDYISDIDAASNIISKEITDLGSDMNILNASIEQTSAEVTRNKRQSGNLDTNYARKVCSRFAEPINDFSDKLAQHISAISMKWTEVENDYLSLLDSKHIKSNRDKEGIKKSIKSLEELQDAIQKSNEGMNAFMSGLSTMLGIERKLNGAINKLMHRLDDYVSMTGTMSSSVDRIIRKSEIVLGDNN